MHTVFKLLAFDTSTDRLSVALSDGVRIWQHQGTGGAQASSTLIPSIQALLAESGLTWDALDAIVFGRGPGSFTGLRTACAVAQGLASGARQGKGIPVLPVDTLMAVAEEARFQAHLAAHPALRQGPLKITALLDARMDEIYAQCYEFNSDQTAGSPQALGPCTLLRPESLEDGALSVPQGEQSHGWAGNVFEVYADRLPEPRPGQWRLPIWPPASAMLRLAPALISAGQWVPAAMALPHYVRDKVALTTQERSAAKSL